MRELFEAIARHAETRPDGIAFEDPGSAVTWRELAGRILTTAAGLRRLGSGPIGIGYSNTIDYVLTDLAATFNGQSIVPLPPFFSAAQIDHLRQVAGLVAIIGPENPAPQAGADGYGLQDAAIEPERIIFTSGSSGTPKGVRLGCRQIMTSARGLLDASAARPSDRYLSILPHAQLLEQIAGIFVPILAGASVIMDPDLTRAFLAGDGAALAAGLIRCNPTTTVIVPRILSHWLDSGMVSPPALRLVALGGAPVSAELLARAAAVGLPVCEGYGLSECCSVVSFNRPGELRPGSAGRPIAGTSVRIEDGEIIVRGPTVMDGYLGSADAGPEWRTGDLGMLDRDGFLHVHGRKDRLIVTSEGRNVSPEWVERQVAHLTDAVLAQIDEELVLITARGARPDDLARALASLPAYARPRRIVTVPPGEEPLFRPDGAPDRLRAQKLARMLAAKTI